MISNYHTHTWRCNHAAGTEEEYIQAAIESGIRTLGFSDHSPCLFRNGFISRIRMLPEQLEDYVSCLKVLRTKYTSELKLHIGVEAEYYPAIFRDTVSFLQDHGIEYMILGQHYIGEEPNRIYSGTATMDEELLKKYCYQSMDAMQTGLFTYFAHPDLIHYVGDNSVYRKYMHEMIREAVQCSIPVEINLLGIAEERHYTGQHFLEIVSEENCPVIIGRDAHSPDAFNDTASEEKAMQMIKQYQLTLLQEVSLRQI